MRGRERLYVSLLFSFLGDNMVYWMCDFKIPTKNASAFLAAAKRIVKQTCGVEWTINKEVGQRVTRLNFWEPAFGYRVDLNTLLDHRREVQQRYNDVMRNVKRKLFDLAEKMEALICVYLHNGKNKYFSAKQIREAEAAEVRAVRIMSRVIKRIRPEVETHGELLTIEDVLASARKEH